MLTESFLVIRCKKGDHSQENYQNYLNIQRIYMYAPLHAFQYFHGIFIGVRCHSDISRPRVLGIPIPKALVMWVSPLTLTQIAKVV